MVDGQSTSFSIEEARTT